MSRTRSILSLAFALLVLISGSSFFVGIHHCGNTVESVAFMTNADGCKHSEMPPCHRKSMQGCCEDEIISHDAQDFKVNTSALELSAVPAFNIVQAPMLVAEIIPAEQSGTFYFDYDSPVRVTDITVDFQIFLI